MRMQRGISAVMLYAALFLAGFGTGLCVKVFMVRGVPVIQGGGELLLLVAIPCCVWAGYRFGRGIHSCTNRR